VWKLLRSHGLPVVATVTTSAALGSAAEGCVSHETRVAAALMRPRCRWGAGCGGSEGSSRRGGRGGGGQLELGPPACGALIPQRLRVHVATTERLHVLRGRVGGGGGVFRAGGGGERHSVAGEGCV
jgi:hypothetical protein